MAGLFEGDGTIYIPKKERHISKDDKPGKRTYPSLQLSFASKDLPLAFALVKGIGQCSIQKVTKKAAYTLTINSTKSLITMVQILNGNLRTPKHKDLGALIDLLNYRYESLKLELLPISTIPLNENA